MPYDHRNTTPDGVSSNQMKLLLEEVNRLHCQNRCMTGSGGGSVGLVLLYIEISDHRENIPFVRGDSMLIYVGQSPQCRLRQWP